MYYNRVNRERMINAMIISLGITLLGTAGMLLKQVISGLVLDIATFIVVMLIVYGVFREIPLKVFFLFVIPMSMGAAAIVIALKALLGVNELTGTVLAWLVVWAWFYVSKNAYELMKEYLRVRV